MNNDYIHIGKIFKSLYGKKSKEKGIPFLCPTIDKLTGGMQPGTLSVLAGGPGSMKTTTSINIAYNAAKEGKNVCVLTLEETPYFLYCKLMSRVSVDLGFNLDVQSIVFNKLSFEDKKTLLEVVHPHFESLKGTIYFVGEEEFDYISQNSIIAKLDEVDNLLIERSKNGGEENHGIDLLIVDHIQMLKYANLTQRDEYRVINEYVNFFRAQSKSFLRKNKPISILLLSQTTREGYNYAQKHNGMYLMQHIAEASELDRAATCIISIYTDAESQLSNIIKYFTVKLRGAPMLMNCVNVFADGKHYHVGESIPVNEFSDYGISEIENLNINIDDINRNNETNNDIMKEFEMDGLLS